MNHMSGVVYSWTCLLLPYRQGLGFRVFASPFNATSGLPGALPQPTFSRLEALVHSKQEGVEVWVSRILPSGTLSPLFGSGFPYKVANRKKGALLTIGGSPNIGYPYIPINTM